MASWRSGVAAAVVASISEKQESAAAISMAAVSKHGISMYEEKRSAVAQYRGVWRRGENNNLEEQRNEGWLSKN